MKKTPAVLHLVLKQPWFDQIRTGAKDIEYRTATPYWKARLEGRSFTHACFSHGYTRHGRVVRRITKIDRGPCPYPGWPGECFRIHLEPMKEGMRE